VLLVLRSSLSSAAQLDQSRACFGLADPLTGSLAAPIMIAQLEGAGRAHHKMLMLSLELSRNNSHSI
jgi:hypothetical protein